MKIGILTFHRVVNHGSLLQAYATCELLKQRYPKADIEIIDYSPIKGLIKEFRSTIITRNFRNLSLSLSRIHKMNNFINNYLPLSPKKLWSNNYNKSVSFINRLNYDVIFVGSDVVFEIKNKHGYAPPIPNIYWLSEKINAKKIAFAASSDKSNVQLNDTQCEILKKSLNSFSLLGLRDNYTESLITNILGKKDEKIIRIPDPTFSLEIKKTNIDKKLIKIGVNLKKPILGLHLPNNILSNKISSHFKEKGYQIISPIFNQNADFNLGGIINSFEWAEVYKYFDFTITNRFHGTIFCIKNKVNFLSINDSKAYENQESKKTSLLKECELLDHLVKHKYSDNFDNIISRISELNINKINFENCIKKENLKLDKFLKQVKKIC